MSSARTSPSVGRTSPRTRRLLHRAGELQPSLLQPLEPRTLLAVTPVGPEFVVEGGGPFYHDVAMNDAGDHVVVWNLFNFQQIVQARRYGADGTPKGDPFYVPLSATEHVVAPSVALDDAGNFIVVAGDRDVLAHRYDAAGNPLGQAFRVNTHAGGFHTSPSVAMDDAGNFVVVWSSSQQDGDGNGSGIYAQRFGADGTPRGGEFRVPDSIAGNQLSPAVAIDDTGAFTIAWVSDVDGSYSSLKVFARRFDPDGTPLTGDLLLSSPVNNSDDYHLDLDVNAHGHAVVTWTSQIVESAPEYILARRLDPAGAFVGDVITVADDADGQRQSTVAIDDVGNFLITWGGFDALPEPGTYGEVVYDENIYARHFAADGTPTAPEFRVNTNVDSVQQEPIVAGDANGDAIVVYMSFAQTGIGGGILAQRYQPLTEPPASVTGSAWDDADADGLRDPGESPLAGVLVNLYNEQGAIAGTTPTDAEGFYRFDVLQPGAQYFLDVHRPPGRVLTLANVGPDEVIDSDFDRNHRRSEPFTVAAGAPAPVFNAGFVRQSTVSGTVFHDRDDDGQRAAGEEPLSGWTVFLDDDADGQFDAGERAVVTGDGGAYSFDAITPGEIRVALQPQRHWTTRPENGVHVIPLGVGVDLTAIDFANHTDVPERHVLPRSDPYEVAPEPDGVGDSAVTIDSAGREIVVWARFNGTDGDVFIRRYAPDGSPLGEPYAVSTFIPMDQAQPDVAALPGGGFVVTFWGYTGDDPVGSFDPEETGIWFQRFGADGMPVGELVRVDDIIARGDIRPALAVHPQSGRFAIAWQSTADGDETVPIGMVRWYDAATGLPLSNPTPLASGISRAENQPQPGFSSDGTLTVIWESNAVYFRRFDADMQPLGAEQPLPADPWETSFAIAPSGDFFIAWQEEIAVSVTRIVARRFAPDGTPIGEEFGVNLYDVSSGRNDYLPDVAASDDGFTVTWRRQTWTESTVYARRYSLAGVPLGSEFPIHDAALDGATPAVAMDDAGGFLVAFPALTVPEFTRGLFARRYLTSPNDAPAASDASANVTLSLDATGSEEKAPVIDLHSLFTDDQPNAALTYSIVGASNPSLFTNYVFAPDGTLKLPLTAHLPGSSTVTVRATDAGGRFADVAFTVTVKPEIILSGDDTYTLGSYVELDLIRLSGNARLNIPQELMISFKTKALELSDNAILDIPSYGLIVEAAPETRDAVLAAAHNWLGTARNYNGGRWTGPGITSSYLRSDDVPPHTSLVAIINPGHLTDGNGVPLGPDAVVITYAYDGDANLDGKVNADDYFKIDSGFLDPPADPTYAHGDFNYDGKINADDYFLIDSAFLAQPPPPAAAAATPAPASPAAMSEEQTKKQRRRAVRPPVDLDPARRR